MNFQPGTLLERRMCGETWEVRSTKRGLNLLAASWLWSGNMQRTIVANGLWTFHCDLKLDDIWFVRSKICLE